MNTTGRRVEALLYAVVVVLAVGWWVGFDASVGNPPGHPHDQDGPPILVFYLQLMGWAAVTSIPSLVAVRLLWRAWWARHGARLSVMDPPALLLAAAAAALPDGRRDWGAAMTAELDRVRGRAARWRFAAGCARVAVLPPGGSRAPVLVVGALTVALAVTAGFAVGAALPALRVFAVVFVALVGALIVLGVARSRRLRPPASAPVVTAAVLAGVAACITAIGYFLIEFPIGALHFPPATAVFLAALLTGCLWLTLSRPRWLTTHRLPSGIAVGAAAALAAGLLVASRLGLRGAVATFAAGIFVYVLFYPVPVIFTGALLAAAAGRSFRAGVQAAVWTALLSTLAIFAVALAEAVRWYELHSSLILAADAVRVEAVGESIRNFAWGLLLYPLTWLPFGVIGAAIGSAGARWWRRRASRVHGLGPQPRGHTTPS